MSLPANDLACDKTRRVMRMDEICCKSLLPPLNNQAGDKVPKATLMRSYTVTDNTASDSGYLENGVDIFYEYDLLLWRQGLWRQFDFGDLTSSLTVSLISETGRGFRENIQVKRAGRRKNADGRIREWQDISSRKEKLWAQCNPRHLLWLQQQEGLFVGWLVA